MSLRSPSHPPNMLYRVNQSSEFARALLPAESIRWYLVLVLAFFATIVARMSILCVPLYL
jgi:hypothetical protein